ncbi:hypothetical protein L3X38_012459 [Prunus dulcis]|uniref:Uncharacterized protein n=1 Tax=Prunus dulcis TaxID=3755 RepID=A0AAD4WM46_PRUDU|nr:hypothetical protein L3X38_012459 [Prunus dulcis]
MTSPPVKSLSRDLVFHKDIFPFQAALPNEHPPPSDTTPVLPTPLHDNISALLPDDPHDTATHSFNDPFSTLPTLTQPLNYLHCLMSSLIPNPTLYLYNHFATLNATRLYLFFSKILYARR